MDKSYQHQETPGFVRHLQRESSVLSDYSSATSTLYVKQDAKAVDVALTIATGGKPSVAFMVDLRGDSCWLQVGFPRLKRRPMTLPFIVPRDTDILFRFEQERTFTLQVEGVIPVSVPIREAEIAVLHHWLVLRGVAR
jgi:hypothetical protein